ncbi:MAG: quinoprotein dehydrogenase-associated putative ABC transporter substrate-binding protein [Acidobacteria bacterium]|nr:quinoprotein dehydrogenase-associated putative ABC transporter substrate-binding protein [Acidobacteriota bacterium]
MCLRFPDASLLVAICLCALIEIASARDLRVCSDPDNLPFSNQKQEGFENHLAALVARELNARLEYVWQRMGRGFVREYLNTGKCDLLIGIPRNFKPVMTTTPYYRSSYVFVTRRDHHIQPASLNDPALRHLKIGVQVLYEDYAPPASALARRGLQNEVVGFESTGEQADGIIRAVADRQVDTAIVWGPLAGYFAQNFGNLLKLRPVKPAVDAPALPFTYAISMGVRKGNFQLRDEIEGVLGRRRSEIWQILDRYDVPQLDLASMSKVETDVE